MTSALSRPGDREPRVVYATGTLYRLAPDSRVKEGRMAICWLGISFPNGFSGWLDTLSAGFSVGSTTESKGYRAAGQKRIKGRGRLTQLWGQMFCFSCVSCVDHPTSAAGKLSKVANCGWWPGGGLVPGALCVSRSDVPYTP